MTKISKAAEEKLMKAIEKTAVFVNDGLSPNEAIAKAAAEDGVPPGHINLMVQAYNTGRTTRQRHDGADTLEKAADFPLAEASKVLECLYPTKVKTAAEVVQQTVVSTQYSFSPTGLLTRREKAARAQTPVSWRTMPDGTEITAPAPYPSDPSTRVKKAYSDTQRLQREIDEARRKKANAFDRMGHTFHELTQYFRRPDATPIPTVREQVLLLHGEKAAQLIDTIVQVTPSLMKLAQHKQAVLRNQLQDVDGEAYGLVSEFLDRLDTYKQLKVAHETVVKTATERSEALLRPFVQRPGSVIEDPPSSTKQADGGLTGWLAPIALTKQILGGSASQMQQPAPAGPANKIYEKLTDPGHEQDLRNIRSQAMLSGLLANDPIISSYDPNEAITAFNEISEMSPRAADKQLLMQTLLRKRLQQGALDPFEVDQMLSMEDMQKRILESSPQQGGGRGSVIP